MVPRNRNIFWFQHSTTVTGPGGSRAPERVHVYRSRTRTLDSTHAHFRVRRRRREGVFHAERFPDCDVLLLGLHCCCLLWAAVVRKSTLRFLLVLSFFWKQQGGRLRPCCWSSRGGLLGRCVRCVAERNQPTNVVVRSTYNMYVPVTWCLVRSFRAKERTSYHTNNRGRSFRRGSK